jgi:hypothetical protein
MLLSHPRSSDLAIDRQVNLPKGFANVEFERHEDAAKAMDYMNGAQIDGNVVRCAYEHEHMCMTLKLQMAVADGNVIRCSQQRVISPCTVLYCLHCEEVAPSMAHQGGSTCSCSC